MIQTILFATDLSVYTSYLLHHVDTLARQYQAKVVVIHAIEPGGEIGDAVVETYLPDDARRELTTQGIPRIMAAVKNRILDALEEEFIDGHSGLSAVRDVQVVPGRAVDVILEQAQHHSADLIVIGSHGQNTPMPNMLGSVTARILQLSRVPVYMVPLTRTTSSQYRQAG